MQTNRRYNIITAALFSLLLCGSTRTAAAQTPFHTIEITGATGSSANGVNSSGDVVGHYWDEYTNHGFLYSGDQLTVIDVPGAAGTIALDINDDGVIVGVYGLSGSERVRGFVRSTGGSYTTVDVGEWVTWIEGINNDGDIVGYYNDAYETSFSGFVKPQGSGTTTINVLGASNTIPYDIDDNGNVVGTADNAHFLWIGGVFTNIDTECPGDEFSTMGINNLGTIVGTNSTGAFVCSTNGLRPFSVPVPHLLTIANRVNDGGVIVGSYIDEGWNSVNFVAPSSPWAMRLTINAFLPYDHIADPHPIFGSDRILEGDGDDRTWAENGLSRTSQIMDIWNQDLGPGDVFLAGPFDWAAMTNQYQTSTSLDGNDKLTYEARSDYELGAPLKTDFGVPVNQGEGCAGDLVDTATVAINCDLETPNGVYPQWLDPQIEYHLSMTFGFTSSPTVNYSISGCIKVFPSYEIWAAGELLYGAEHSEDPFDIVLSCESGHQLEETGTVTLQ